MTKLIVPHDNPQFNGGGGVKSTLSFQRLETLLRVFGELKSDEIISGFEVDAFGIQYTIIKLE